MWRGGINISLEVFMILFDVSFLFDVELTSILSYSMHIVTQTRCSLFLFLQQTLICVIPKDLGCCVWHSSWVTVRLGKNEEVMIAVIALT